MKEATPSPQRPATFKSIPKASSVDVPFSIRLRRIASLLEDEAGRSVSGRLSEFFRQECERMREIARLGVKS